MKILSNFPCNFKNYCVKTKFIFIIIRYVFFRSSHQDVYIKITGGSRYRGHLGRILNKDKKKETVNVQLLENRDQVLTISYDDVCEYIGRVEDHYNY